MPPPGAPEEMDRPVREQAHDGVAMLAGNAFPDNAAVPDSPETDVASWLGHDRYPPDQGRDDPLSVLGRHRGPAEQGAAMVEQLLAALRETLASAIGDVFLVVTVALAVSFVVTMFLKEVPLRTRRPGARVD